MERTRGFIDLVFDAVEETTNLVERTHDAVVERSVRRFAPVEPAKSTARVVTGLQKAIAGGVFETIRTVNGVTRFAVDKVADAADAQRTFRSETAHTPMRSDAAGSLTWYADQAQASLNGLWGDHFRRRGSRLELGMTVRDEGRPVALTQESIGDTYREATPKLCVFVHSLAATEWLWSLSSEAHYGEPNVTFGSRLRGDLGFTPVYLRYNTGRHVSENGRVLAELLGRFVDAYPVPVEEVALVGHSMGGLVARSAAHYGRERGERWVEALRHVACIGSPHLGAPLAKAAHVLSGALRHVDAAGAQVPAELIGSRSAGIRDLRHGYTIDEEWEGSDPDRIFGGGRHHVPLVDGVGYYFLAATISRDPGHPLGRLVGDLMVRLPSASGQSKRSFERIRFSDGAVLPGLGHVELANHPAVYEALHNFLRT